MNSRPMLLLFATLAALPGVRAADACPCCAAAAAAAPALSSRSVYQLDASWTTDAGRSFQLAALRGRPVVLAMFFTSCGYACPRIVADMTQIQQTLPAAVRDQARFVLVSFDDRRDTVAALQAYREAHGLNASWVLLRGAPDDIRELAAVLGVKYKRDAAGMFQHSNLITVLNPEGEIVHQRAGLEGGLAEAGRAVVAADTR
ncbi:MAG TPA: SCO family protein [Opitutaceae bacterium]|nr:SCO family protein [Opitutaceae bacterium]